MARRRLLIAGIAGCLALLAAAGVVVALGLGGVAWLWITGDGSWQRAQQRAEIDRQLHVTIESVGWRGEKPPAEGPDQPLACRLVLENTGDRAIKRVEGTVLLLDANGWTTFSCGVDEAAALAPHATVTIDLTLECIGYRPSSGNTNLVDPAGLDRSWSAHEITFDDGTSIGVFPRQ